MYKFLSILVLALVMTGCNSTLQTNAAASINCHAPGGKKLAEAISQSRSTLVSSQCHYSFESHFNRLLEIAAGEPSSNNKVIFRDFLVFAQNTGMISKRQMQQKFTRHFSETFVSLPDNQSVCQVGKDLERVAAELDTELAQKKLGLLSILGDKQTYYSAARQRESAVLILAATAQACGGA